MNIKVLELQALERVLELEKRNLAMIVADEMEREMQSWQAPWRQEALEHYLANGWCFGVWEGEEYQSELKGYFLAQPILFFRGMTQTMWVEHMSIAKPEVSSALIEVIYKLSREKRMQKLLVSGQAEQIELWAHLNPTMINDSIFEIKTAKIQ